MSNPLFLCISLTCYSSGLRGALLPTTYRGLDQQMTGRHRLPKAVEAALEILSRVDNTSILIISSSPVTVSETQRDLQPSVCTGTLTND